MGGADLIDRSPMKRVESEPPREPARTDMQTDGELVAGHGAGRRRSCFGQLPEAGAATIPGRPTKGLIEKSKKYNENT